MSARKTALIIRWVFNIPVSYQTVLNYAQAAAYYAHQFNLSHKGPIENISMGDEVYIKVEGEDNHVWFFISPKRRTIIAYHMSDNRETQSATAAINEAIRTAQHNQELTIITDGLGAYTEAVHYLKKYRNHSEHNKIKMMSLNNIAHLSNSSNVSTEPTGTTLDLLLVSILSVEPCR